MSDTLDMNKALELTEQVFGYMGGAIVSGMIHLGDVMGLYKTMNGAGSLTPAELAERTGLKERWLLEWLRGQGAAGLLTYHGDDRFELNAEQAAILADEEGSPFFAAGAFGGLPDLIGLVRELPESFRSGLGYPFDAHGAAGNEATARMFAPWFRHMLVPLILPGLDGVVPRLEAGAKVADVGCGAGIALIIMAGAFPNSEFHGYDIAKEALQLAERNAQGVNGVTFHDASVDTLPEDESFDLITAFDCLHDMTQPAQVIASIRRSLKPDGTFLAADIKSYPTYEENLENNPMVAMMYSMSVLSCMSSALSEPDGAGLGTLGLHEPLMRQMCTDAGFSRMEVHDFGNPVNRYYEVRV